MTRTTPRRIAWIFAAASALALGAAAIHAGGRAAAPPPAAAAPRGALPSLFETLTLMRWGQGALDWTLPDPQGDRHARTEHHRA